MVTAEEVLFSSGMQPWPEIQVPGDGPTLVHVQVTLNGLSGYLKKERSHEEGGIGMEDERRVDSIKTHYRYVSIVLKYLVILSCLQRHLSLWVTLSLLRQTACSAARTESFVAGD